MRCFDSSSVSVYIFGDDYLLKLQDKKTKEGEKMVPVKLRMSGLKPTTQNRKSEVDLHVSLDAFSSHSPLLFNLISYKYYKMFVVILCYTYSALLYTLWFQ